MFSRYRLSLFACAEVTFILPALIKSARRKPSLKIKKKITGFCSEPFSALCCHVGDSFIDVWALRAVGLRVRLRLEGGDFVADELLSTSLGMSGTNQHSLKPGCRTLGSCRSSEGGESSAAGHRLWKG